MVEYSAFATSRLYSLEFSNDVTQFAIMVLNYRQYCSFILFFLAFTLYKNTSYRLNQSSVILPCRKKYWRLNLGSMLAAKHHQFHRFAFEACTEPQLHPTANGSSNRWCLVTSSGHAEKCCALTAYTCYISTEQQDRMNEVIIKFSFSFLMNKNKVNKCSSEHSLNSSNCF